MKRRLFVASALAAFVLPRALAAQNTTRVARIGWLTGQHEASLAPFIDALRGGLADLGHVEGQNLVIEFRFADGSVERLPELAMELVRLSVDLIMAQGAAVSTIRRLSLPVPTVYVFSGDPVSAGLAETLARPLWNMTGVTMMAAELNGKRIELLNEIVPALHRVFIVGDPGHAGAQVELTHAEETARRLGIAAEWIPTHTRDDLKAALAEWAVNPPQAVSLLADSFSIQNRQTIIDAAMTLGAPVISGWPVFARSGAVCTFGPRLQDSYRRLAHYVDRILKGAKPSDLPIERPTTYELVVNLKSARALGLAIPQSLLARADEVIE